LLEYLIDFLYALPTKIAALEDALSETSPNEPAEPPNAST
jgi:hypothetical protein